MIEHLIYVSGPYTEGHGRTVEENIDAAKNYGREVRKLGFTPCVPHIVILPFEDPSASWKPAMRECLAFMAKCSAVVVLPNWRKSRGARVEVWIARRWGIPVLELPDLDFWGRTGRRIAA